MIRALYAALLCVHPPAFRQRFAAEMLCIFDEVSSSRERSFLLYDALRSFAFQWLFRSKLWIFAVAFLLALVSALIGLHPYS